MRSLLSTLPPPSPLLQAFISLHGFGSDVLFPAFSQERERGGERRRKGGLFKQGMTDALLKEAGPFEKLAPPCSPHPVCLAHCHGAVAAAPPRQALCHCKSPHRLKQTRSEKTHPFSTVTLRYSGVARSVKNNDCLAVTKHTGDTEMGVTCGEEGTGERRDKVWG